MLAPAVLRVEGLTTVASEVSDARREKALRSGVADVVVDPSVEVLIEKGFERLISNKDNEVKILVTME